jgi:hypothetical protein
LVYVIDSGDRSRLEVAGQTLFDVLSDVRVLILIQVAGIDHCSLCRIKLLGFLCLFSQTNRYRYLIPSQAPLVHSFVFLRISFKQSKLKVSKQVSTCTLFETENGSSCQVRPLAD